MNYLEWRGASAPPLVTEWYEIDFVTTSDAASSDALGSQAHSICLSRDGSVAVIGCPADDSSKGAAYVFTRSGDAWTQFTKLTGSDSAAGDQFGYSVAISGDGLTIAVGAPLDDIGAFANAGSTYIFRFSAGAWSQQTRLGPSGGLTQANKQMGFAVALSEDGNTCASGSPGLASNNGGAYVHVFSAGSWSQQAQLLPSSASGQTGRSIAITSNGNYIAAGGPFTSTNAGAVQTWSRSGTTWTFDEAITRSGSNQFGQSVSLDDTGTTMIIGANTAFGAVYTYAASTWSLHTSFGLSSITSVAMSGDGTKLAFAFTTGTPGTMTYELSAGVWNNTQLLAPSTVTSVWMAKDAEHMGVTDPTDDTAASNAGAAYFFRYGPH